MRAILFVAAIFLLAFLLAWFVTGQIARGESRPGGCADDLDRFPGAQEAADGADANASWQRWLEHQALAYPWRLELGEAMCEAQAAGRAWEALKDCRAHPDYNWPRNALRDALGEANYRAGRMPEPVARWRLHERD